MKHIRDIRDYYYEDLLLDLRYLERLRKLNLKILRKIAIYMLIMFVITFMILEVILYKLWLFIIAVSMIMFWLFFYKKVSRNYVKEFREVILHRVIGFVDPALKYKRKNRISKKAFMESKIIKREPDRFTAKGYVSGIIGRTQIDFAEIVAEYEKGKSDNYTKRQKKRRLSQNIYIDSTYDSMFDGMFFIADCDKQFKGVAVLLPDTMDDEDLIGSLAVNIQSMNFDEDMEMKRLPVEEDKADDFSKYYVLYGDSELDTEHIFSDKLIRKMVEFKQKTKRRIFISSLNTRIYVAISYRPDESATRIFSNIVDFKVIREYVQTIQLAFDIIQDFNLNARIWLK